MMTPSTFDLRLYLWSFGLIVVSCALLVISNYVITSKISLIVNQPAGNPHSKSRSTIVWYLLMLAVALVLPLFGRDTIIMVSTFFVLALSRLLSFSWPCLVHGSEKYMEDTKRYYVETASWKFWTIILLKLIPVYVLGILVGIAGMADPSHQFWYLRGIGTGISFFAIYFAFIDAFLRIKYKREAKKADTGSTHSA